MMPVVFRPPVMRNAWIVYAVIVIGCAIAAGTSWADDALPGMTVGIIVVVLGWLAWLAARTRLAVDPDSGIEVVNAFRRRQRIGWRDITDVAVALARRLGDSGAHRRQVGYGWKAPRPCGFPAGRSWARASRRLKIRTWSPGRPGWRTR